MIAINRRINKSLSLFLKMNGIRHLTSNKEVIINFDEGGSVKQVSAKIGESLLEAAHNSSIELEGACDGSLACSTCHVILEKDIYDRLPSATDEENDMLDLAFGLTETSRLGCQVVLNESLNGIKVKVPSATRNISHLSINKS
jgi:ferredoxin